MLHLRAPAQNGYQCRRGDRGGEGATESLSHAFEWSRTELAQFGLSCQIACHRRGGSVAVAGRSAGPDAPATGVTLADTSIPTGDPNVRASTRRLRRATHNRRLSRWSGTCDNPNVLDRGSDGRTRDRGSGDPANQA